MKVTQAILDALANKFISSLPACLNQQEVINYNFYNNASGVGVKVSRKKMTIEDLALIVTQGFAEQKIFNEEVKTFMAEQKIFNEEVKTFMAEQKIFNEEVKTFMAEQKVFNKEVLRRLDRIENCPTIKRELAAQ